MGDEITRQLAALPPHLWAESLRRMEVVNRYLDLEKPTTADADRSAAELQLVQRSFFRLAAAVRDLRAGGEPKVSRQGQQSPLPSTTRAVLAATIADLGPGARDSEIFAESHRRCKEQGLLAPSWNAVRTRTGKPVLSPDLRGRLRKDADFVLDACPLDLTVSGTNSEAALAVLTALIHMESASVLGFHLCAGQVSDAAVAASFLDALDDPANGGATQSRHLRLIMSAALRPCLPAVERLAAAARVQVDKDGSEGLRPGVALTSAVGRKIGRIPFAPLGRAAARPELSVPLHHARAVIGELLARRSRVPAAEQRGSFQGLVGSRSARRVRDVALNILEDRR
ncbi:hypothetical protein [Sphingomonas sp. LHG3443-2]|uniref:hypothetical protein n=1 Tax=Sphingomonas sp. LHG3443-2 TaxID=2804639 RepID=UPI003CF5351C